MKRKVIAFALALLTFFTLGACEDLGTQIDLPEGYDINVVSDVESFDYSIDTDSEGTITFELGEYDESAYAFSHWENEAGDVLSEESSFIFDFEAGDYTVEAIFDQVETPDDSGDDTNDEDDNTDDSNDDNTDDNTDEEPVISEVYATSFESTEVGFWSDYGTYDFDGVEWIQNQTANTVYPDQDRFNGDASIRIDEEEDSFIYTLDAFSEVNSFSFVAANTHMDSNGELSVSISKDASTWTELSVETLTDTLDTYEYTLVFDDLDGFSYSDAIHMRIDGVSGRINVDDFKVFGGSEAITQPDDSNDDSSGDDSNNDGDAQIDIDGEFIDKDNVALYLHTYDELPDNYMAYDEFATTGWDESELRSETGNDLMSLGYKDFHNYEGLLPDGKTYHSADINFDGGHSRGVERLVFSEDGLIYYTGDHYESFELLYGNPDGSDDSSDDNTTDPGTGDNNTPQDPDLEGNLADLLDEDLITYFDQAEGLYGSTLDDALTTILNDNVNHLSYDDAKWVLEESDKDPDNPNNIILVYTRESIKGQWDYPNWNREHVWPQSKLASSGAKADAHHLKPSDVSENSSRGNLPFGESGSTYEPPDVVKGDVARMLFYMDARYNSLDLRSGVLGDLGLLLEWHVQDPVDDFERNRNDVIFDYQNNRNPFIDHPHLALLMFNDHPSVNVD